MKVFLVLLLSILPLSALTDQSQQAVVGITSSWSSSHANLYLYEKKDGSWIKVAGPWKTRLGRSGSAWGKGIHANPKGSILKKEGDEKTPAGVFSIGGAWGDAAQIKRHPSLPYRKVTPRDLWVEDSKSPYYNQHLILKHDPKSTWEKKAQMKQNDHAHSLKLFIAHNAPPKATPGAGSAVFFHIWRGGGSKSTFGCTTMPESTLKNLVAWIDPAKNPIYILLPQAEYTSLRGPWKLP
ncbi:L,D-transpeptidase family protein [Akkermansiaceae bacterium]|nr:L,D-transpeptidase family protein [Akkermansiaceae bacterium]MDC0287053.1 L,D-transpeptidase family protein [Akkermansiaceae bacterium]